MGGDCVAPLVKEMHKKDDKERKLFGKLDKGIDDMEQGNTISHEDTMRMIREKVLQYHV